MKTTEGRNGRKAIYDKRRKKRLKKEWMKDTLRGRNKCIENRGIDRTNVRKGKVNKEKERDVIRRQM